MPHICHRSHPVVGQAIDDHRRTAGAIALVTNFLVADAFQFAGALLDRAIDVVVRHVLRLGLVDGHPQARVEAGIAAAHLGRHGDFLGVPGKNLAPLFILAAFAVLDVCPFAECPAMIATCYEKWRDFTLPTAA
jgi:hypothetical protein